MEVALVREAARPLGSAQSRTEELQGKSLTCQGRVNCPAPDNSSNSVSLILGYVETLRKCQQVCATAYTPLCFLGQSSHSAAAVFIFLPLTLRCSLLF